LNRCARGLRIGRAEGGFGDVASVGVAVCSVRFSHFRRNGAVGVALFSVFLIPLILLALVFRIGFFFLKVGLAVALLAVLLVSCV
jgi:hypothetical protein